MKNLGLLSIFLFIILLNSSLLAQQNDVITIGKLSAAPGDRISGTVAISSEENTAFVPITIVNGKNPGP
ncbi:MAG TPA: hypothetical protein P5227_02645, partial [Emcibacteraceae bacterium]|nr:hypothetical protein [Emcibacteraceae bacterium]